MIATTLTRNSAKPILSCLRLATTRGVSHLTPSGNVVSATWDNVKKPQTHTFATVATPANVDNDSLVFNSNSTTQSMVHQRGTVTKTLKALDMAVVRQIKAELLSVDQNNDGRQVITQHYQINQQESIMFLSRTP